MSDDFRLTFADDVAPQLVTIKRAAALAGVSRRTIHNWITGGKLKTYRTPSQAPRIYAPDLRPVREEDR